MELVIEKIGAHNWQDYRTIRLKALQDEPKAFSSTYEREVAWKDVEWKSRAVAENSLILVAKTGDKIVGIIGVYWQDNQKEKGEIWSVFVDKDYRGQGIGKQLMLAIEKEARKNGTKTAGVEVALGQDAALHLYKSLGYVEVRRNTNQHRLNKTCYNSLVLEKAL